MAEQGVGQFYEALSKDKEIRNQISQIQVSTKDNEEVLEMVLPIAKQLGFDLTKEDFAQYAQGRQQRLWIGTPASVFWAAVEGRMQMAVACGV